MRLYLASYKLKNKPEELLQLVGDNKRTVVIINAMDYKTPQERDIRLQPEIDALKALGLEPEELDLRQYFGKPDELKEVMKSFGFVWVRGGNVFLLRRAFQRSDFDTIITEMLKNNEIAYGGYSAGVCILAPSLHGLELVDPTDRIGEGYDAEIIWDGLGILDYSVAPHYKSDHYESEDVGKCVEYLIDNHILFRALRDGEAILIDGDRETIVSQGNK